MKGSAVAALLVGCLLFQYLCFYSVLEVPPLLYRIADPQVIVIFRHLFIFFFLQVVLPTYKAGAE